MLAGALPAVKTFRNPWSCNHCHSLAGADGAEVVGVSATRISLKSRLRQPARRHNHVGPPSLLGTSFIIGRDGTRDHVIRMYEVHVRRSPDLIAALPELAGKRLAFARKAMPLLDDWVDGHPDAWDYDAVLRENDVQVEWCDTMIDGEGIEHRAGEFAGWSMSWKHGVIFVGRVSETIARKAAALFVSLWLRGVPASFCDKLMAGFIMFLERQENTRLTFLAEIDHSEEGGDYFRITHKGLCTRRHFGYGTDSAIIAALGTPKPGEEIIITFTKRKVHKPPVPYGEYQSLNRPNEPRKRIQ